MAAGERQGEVTLTGAFQALLAAAGVGFVLQHVVERIWEQALADRPLASTITGIAAFVLLAAAGSTRRRLLFLSSRHLAVASLASLSVLGILGSVVVQGAPPQVYEATYGWASRIILYLLLDDVFHGMPFAMLLAAASAGLALSFLRTSRLDLRRVGILLAHGGCLLVMAGACVQSLAGVQGRLELHEGEGADTFLAQTARGVEPVAMGFTLRLDDFELLSYEPEIRLRVIEAGVGRQELLASVDPGEALGDPAALERFGVKVLDYWPDHRMRQVVEPADVGVPALGLGTADGEEAWLLDTGRLEDARVRVGQGALVTFFWREADARAFAGEAGSGAPSPHVIVTPGGPLRVEPGSTYALPGRSERIRVEAYYNDLVLDTGTREASNRSDEPRNPALRVLLVGADGTVLEGTWLFALTPSFHSSDPSSPLAELRYSYEPAGGMETWIVVGETRTVLGPGGEPGPLPGGSGGTIGIGGEDVRMLGLLESASATTVHETRSERPLRPVVRVGMSEAPDGAVILPEGYGADLGGGLHLVLARKEDSDRDYLSRVSVIEAGRTVQTRTIEVNHPLSHRGLTFYQSDFRPEDPTFSGLQVVGDPGLPVVYAGFAVTSAGILGVFYLAPFLGRRRRREA